MARDENGNTIRVPGDTTYKQWLEKYHPELVDKSAESGIINLAQPLEMLNFYDVESLTEYTPEGVMEELNKSSIGRETLKYIETLPEPIKFTTGYESSGVRGEHIGSTINIYVNNCKNNLWVARTIIHECTHQRYGIGNSQWAECVCVAQELKHARGRDKLTVQELRMIVGAVKSEYSEYNWRRGGMINGRRKIRK